MDPEKINFYVARDFTELYNAVTKFLSRNFRHFFKTLIFIAGPVILLNSIFRAFYLSKILSYTNAGGFTVNATPDRRIEFLEKYSQMFSEFGWSYFLLILFGICANLILLTTVYSYMVVYQERGPGNFDVTEVRQLVFRSIGKTIKGFLVLMMIIVAGIITISIVVGLLGALMGSIAVLVFILFLLALLMTGPPWIWQFSSFFLVQIVEKAGVSQSLARVRALMKGQFFYTWLIVFSGILILVIVSFVFMIPQFFYQVMVTMGNLKGEQNSLVPLSVITAVTTFLTNLVYSIFYVICGFHYYSLAEQKDGTSLLSRIDEIGSTDF